MATYKGSYEGIGELLRSEMMVAAMAERAKAVQEMAEQLAPESIVGSTLSPPGRYKKSFRVETSKRGGFRKNRAEAKVVNDDPVAVFVEYGTTKMPGMHVLLRALFDGLKK